MAVEKSPVVWQSQRFEELMKVCIGNAGRGKVAVVSDFDRTLTTGQSIECHNLIARAEAMHFDFREEVRFLDELSQLPPDKKTIVGDEWWILYNDLIKKHRIHDDHIREAVHSHPCPLLRPGVQRFHQSCVENDIPFVVISAGFTNVVHHTFVKESGGHPVPHIIANHVDHTSTTYPIKTPITSYTKHQALQHASEHLMAKLVDYPVTLVLGDKPNDSMAAELHPRNVSAEHDLHLIKIGMMNESWRFDDFREHFDVILDGHCPTAFTFVHDQILAPLLRDPTLPSSS